MSEEFSVLVNQMRFKNPTLTDSYQRYRPTIFDAQSLKNQVTAASSGQFSAQG